MVGGGGRAATGNQNYPNATFFNPPPPGTGNPNFAHATVCKPHLEDEEVPGLHQDPEGLQFRCIGVQTDRTLIDLVLALVGGALASATRCNSAHEVHFLSSTCQGACMYIGYIIASKNMKSAL